MRTALYNSSKRSNHARSVCWQDATHPRTAHHPSVWLKHIHFPTLNLFTATLPKVRSTRYSFAFFGHVHEDRRNRCLVEPRLICAVTGVGGNPRHHSFSDFAGRVASRGGFVHYHPESGKKSGKGNGVVPIKAKPMKVLLEEGWTLEYPWEVATKAVGPGKSRKGSKPGDIDAAKQFDQGLVVVEWETGNISSSHRIARSIKWR